MSFNFLTFADSRLVRSLRRVKEEADLMGCFDRVFLMTENDLSDTFFLKFQDVLKPNVRGYGYWCWKPQVILQALKKLEDNDLLLYADVGCSLNAKGLDRLYDYFKIVEKSSVGVLAFQGVPPVYPFPYDGRPLPDLTEKFWAKGDVLDYFNVRHKAEITETQTYGAGVILLKKCHESVSLINDWMKVINTSFALLDDTPSKSANAEGFIEHRHDQAIFSILCKIYHVDTISAYEYSYPNWNSGEDWSTIQNMPIHAKRDLDFGLIGNLQRFIRNKIYGLKKRLYA